MYDASYALHVCEGEEVSRFVYGDSKIDDSRGEAVPDVLRKLGVTYCHYSQYYYYQLICSIVSTYTTHTHTDKHIRSVAERAHDSPPFDGSLEMML